MRGRGRPGVGGLRGLPRHYTAYRIGDPDGRHPVFSPAGASQVEGRWHDRGDKVIYAAEHYSTAMLEKLARWRGAPPRNQHYIEISIPVGGRRGGSGAGLAQPQCRDGTAVRSCVVRREAQRSPVRAVDGRPNGAEHHHQRRPRGLSPNRTGLGDARVVGWALVRAALSSVVATSRLEDCQTPAPYACLRRYEPRLGEMKNPTTV